MSTRNQLKTLTALLSCWAMSATAQGLNLPDGHVEWQCGNRWDDCRLVRKDANGLPVTTANPAAVGTLRSRLTLSHDGKTIYAPVNRNLTALNAETLQPRWRQPLFPNASQNDVLPTVMAESPDGSTLAVSRTGYGEAARQDWGNIILLKAGTGEVIRTLQHPVSTLKDEWQKFYNTVTALAFTPDGSALAVGSTGGGIRVIQLDGERETRLQGACGWPRPVAHAGPVRDLRWTTNSTLISTANDGTVRLWKNGQPSACLTVKQGGFQLHGLPNGQLLVQNATTFTLVNLATFKKVRELGPTVSAVQDVRVSPSKVTLADETSEQDYALPSGEFLAVRGPNLAQLRQGNTNIEVRPNLQVNVTQGGKMHTLNAKVIPPENVRGWKKRWSISLTGQSLRVDATNYVRVMTMEGDDFQNRYVWNVNTGKLLSCETWQMGLMYGGEPQKTATDAACKAALQHGQGRQDIKTVWHE
ncbi:hypothetical protein D3875_07460 [Deinococcus cavernae]|uniref:Uncharacterized protein n=1 Tax=Deinococcus cavernae TaxID=2320857 RepID=A0A418V5P5_9DEIO|nr:WD40 repeat domain-containing protein [Deinococcus cavernae]RJF71433.1 hypothetical protein D3875_07460 [Deinococcus cavernae]